MAAAERPLVEVLNTIFGSVEEIVRSEVNLARAELREDIARSADAAHGLAVTLLGGFFAGAFVLLALFFLLAHIMPQWAAALSIGVTLTAVSALSLHLRRARIRALRRWLSPFGTHFKETMPWLKQRTR